MADGMNQISHKAENTMDDTDEAFDEIVIAILMEASGRSREEILAAKREGRVVYFDGVPRTVECPPREDGGDGSPAGPGVAPRGSP
jgi:hypothetical protein